MLVTSISSFSHNVFRKLFPNLCLPCWVSSVVCQTRNLVIVSETWLRGTSFPVYFRLQLKLVRKEVGRFGKKVVLVKYWCEKARKHMCVIDRHDMTLTLSQTSPGFYLSARLENTVGKG